MGVLSGLYGGTPIQRAARLTQEGVARSKIALDLIPHMQRRLDILTLACMAMWEILKERGGATEEELARRMEALDLSDGAADGKVRGEANV